MPAVEWDVFALAPNGSTDAPTFLTTLYDAQEKRIRVEKDGPGSGSFVISRYSTEATATNLAQGNLVKVRIPEIDTDYLFAFFLETGDFTLVSTDEEGGELLRFGGRGALAYLAKAVMWSASYITRIDQPDDITDTGAILGDDPVDGVWRLYLQGPDIGRKPGQLFGRLIAEGRAYARPQHPIPLVTNPDWGYTTDSTSDAWDDSDAVAEFAASVGDSVLDVALKLIETDTLTVQMGPDFDLHVYNRNNYGRDLTGDAFGTGVVRFEKGINIAEELRRSRGEEATVATHMLNAGEVGQYGTAALTDAASRVVQEAFMTAFGTGATSLAGQAASELQKRLDKRERIAFQIANRRTAVTLTDPVTVGATIGPGATEGYYLPGPAGTNGDFWVGDTVRVFTGSLPFDFEEVDFTVEAITIARDDANHELVIIPELLEVGPAPGVLVCSVSLAASVVASDVGIDSAPTASPTVDITTTTAQSVVIAVTHGRNGNTPSTTDYAVGSGWTELDHYWTGTNTAPLLGVEYKVGVTPGTYTADATFAVGYDAAGWRQVALAFQTSTMSLVQHAVSTGEDGNVDLPDPPAAGDILIVAVSCSDTSGALDDESWTVLDNGVTTGWPSRLIVAARCVLPGDGQHYTASPGSGKVLAISEWAIT